MNIRRLTPEDRSLHKAMSDEIVKVLPSPDFLIPMTEEEYDVTYTQGSDDVVYGMFADDGTMIATSSMLYNVEDYRPEQEVSSIIQSHRCVEIGECMVLPSHRGKGLMLRLNRLILKTAREAGVEYMLATAHPDNVASNTSLRHLGFELVKEFDRHGYRRNLYIMEVGDEISISDAQSMVDEWIRKYGVRYFSELTNMAVLTEEVGELARIMSRRYGDQSFKQGEPTDPADEMADVLWVLLCLANQTGVDLTDALRRNIEKKTRRDSKRHINNEKLK